MAARSGLSQLIEDTRLNCELGTADYTVSTVTYWSDDQIQRELDRQRRDVRQELLHIESEYSSGTVEYKDYYWRFPHVEQYDASNAEIFHLEDGNGSVIGTADYTVNYEAQHIRFSADQVGSARYLTYRAYDLDRVSATLWKQKAAHVALRVDVKTDNHDIKGSQLQAHYMAMAKQFMQSAKPTSRKMVRSDML